MKQDQPLPGVPTPLTAHEKKHEKVNEFVQTFAQCAFGADDRLQWSSAWVIHWPQKRETACFVADVGTIDLLYMAGVLLKKAAAVNDRDPDADSKTAVKIAKMLTILDPDDAMFGKPAYNS